MLPHGIISILTGGLFKTVENVFRDYTNQKISAEEAKAKIAQAQEAAKSSIEASWAESLAKATESVQATVRASPPIQRAIAGLVVMEASVLLWYQVGTPAFQLITGTAWPDPGITLEWAYALLASTVGAGIFSARR